MATPTAPSTTEPVQSPPKKWTPISRNICLFAAVACPILLAIPPRRLNLVNVLNAGIFVGATNHLSVVYTDRNLTQNLLPDLSKLGSDELPTEKAKRFQAERERRKNAAAEQARRLEEVQRDGWGSHTQVAPTADGTERVPTSKQGVLEELWMGKEKPGWKERRLEEERKAIEEGRGYGGLIMDYVRDAFGTKKLEEVAGKKLEEMEKQKEAERAKDR